MDCGYQPVEEVATAPRGGRKTPKKLVVHLIIAFFNGVRWQRSLPECGSRSDERDQPIHGQIGEAGHDAVGLRKGPGGVVD